MDGRTAGGHLAAGQADLAVRLVLAGFLRHGALDGELFQAHLPFAEPPGVLHQHLQDPRDARREAGEVVRLGQDVHHPLLGLGHQRRGVGAAQVDPAELLRPPAEGAQIPVGHGDASVHPRGKEAHPFVDSLQVDLDPRGVADGPAEA